MKLYVYNAYCTSVFDGDSITVDINLGFNMSMKDQKIRLFGVNTPEMYKGTEESKKVAKNIRDWLRNKIQDKEITINTIKDKKGKYGRWLGVIWVNGENINDSLVSKGYGQTY